MAVNPADVEGGVQTVPLADLRPRTNYRWVVCALLFFATTINYVDRQVLGILAPTLQRDIGWSEADYGFIIAAFTFAYALAYPVFGRIIDLIGTKRGYALSLIVWSIAAMGHALVRTPFGFAAARFSLGLGEAGNFPASIRAVSEWFPKRERALATGIFNAGTNIGAVIAPLIVPWIALTYGWQWAFIITGALGSVWLVFWLTMYREPSQHPRVSAEELSYIRSDAEEQGARMPWLSLFKYRQTWAFAAGKFITDPIWWFYLYWLPTFLDEKHGITLEHIAGYLITVYLLADIGSIGGGWISGFFIKRGWTVNRGRKTAMLICALCIVPTILVTQVESAWGAIALVSLAASAHQGWSANLFTTASDLFPRRAVASVVGIGGFIGAIGGMLFQAGTGLFLEWSGSNYTPVFIVCGLAYLVALGVIHVLVPRMHPAEVTG